MLMPCVLSHRNPLMVIFLPELIATQSSASAMIIRFSSVSARTKQLTLRVGGRVLQVNVGAAANVHKVGVVAELALVTCAVVDSDAVEGQAIAVADRHGLRRRVQDSEVRVGAGTLELEQRVRLEGAAVGALAVPVLGALTLQGVSFKVRNARRSNTYVESGLSGAVEGDVGAVDGEERALG